jgi:hypothetical protein
VCYSNKNETEVSKSTQSLRPNPINNLATCCSIQDDCYKVTITLKHIRLSNLQIRSCVQTFPAWPNFEGDRNKTTTSTSASSILKHGAASNRYINLTIHGAIYPSYFFFHLARFLYVRPETLGFYFVIFFSFLNCGWYCDLWGSLWRNEKLRNAMRFRKAWINAPKSNHFTWGHEAPFLPTGLLTGECHKTRCLLFRNGKLWTDLTLQIRSRAAWFSFPWTS